jgi:hypothetical protein
MTENITDPTDIERIAREAARDEANNILEEPVEADDGEEWSVRKMMDRFELSRRAALGAMGLLIVGSVTDPVEAALRAVSQPAAAQTQDLTVPGTVNASAVSTEVVQNASSAFAIYEINLAANSKQQLDPDAAARPAMFHVTATNGNAGIVSVDTAGQESVTLIAGNGLGTTEGGSAPLNVFWDGSNSRVEIQNTESFQQPVSIFRSGFQSQ